MVALQGLAEKAANQAYHLLIVAEMLRLVQRHIIFVNQQDCLLPVMLVQKRTKGLKAGGEHFPGHAKELVVGGINVDQLLIGCLFAGSKRITVQQELKSHGFLSDGGTEHSESGFVIIAVHILQGDGDYWIVSHVFFTKLLLRADGKPLKKLWITTVLKKVFQHVHIKGFAEPSGTCKQIYASPALQEILYQGCLINIVKTVYTDIFKVLHADWQSVCCVHVGSFLGYQTNCCSYYTIFQGYPQSRNRLLP